MKFWKTSIANSCFWLVESLFELEHLIFLSRFIIFVIWTFLVKTMSSICGYKVKFTGVRWGATGSGPDRKWRNRTGSDASNVTGRDTSRNRKWWHELQRGPIRHNGAKKKLQLKHKNSLFTLQTFHYNYYWWPQSLLNRVGWEIYAFQR